VETEEEGLKHAGGSRVEVLGASRELTVDQKRGEPVHRGPRGHAQGVRIASADHARPLTGFDRRDQHPEGLLRGLLQRLIAIAIGKLASEHEVEPRRVPDREADVRETDLAEAGGKVSFRVMACRLADLRG